MLISTQYICNTVTPKMKETWSATNFMFPFKQRIIPYSGNVWWVESLANLVNRLQFAKLKPFEVVVTINKLLADLLKRANLPNILPAKLSHYTVIINNALHRAIRYCLAHSMS